MSQDSYTSQDLPYDGQQNAVTVIAAYLQHLSRVATQEKQLIAGLGLVWLSGTGLRVTQGCAYVQGKGLGTLTANKDKTGLSLSASTWYHVYLYYNTGSLLWDVEVVTTAPASYFGTAYQKTGDATRRYLGSVRTNGSAALHKFYHQGDTIHYLENTTATPFRVLSAGVATVETVVSCNGVVPVTSKVVLARVANTATNTGGSLGNSEEASGATMVRGFLAVMDSPFELPLDGSQAFSYKYGVAPTGGGGLYSDVSGYRFVR
jgi:hypothetical protein